MMLIAMNQWCWAAVLYFLCFNMMFTCFLGMFTTEMYGRHVQRCGDSLSNVPSLPLFSDSADSTANVFGNSIDCSSISIPHISSFRTALF
ncbi:hypothetical protein M514_09591 [Trichuris suis]|uniref:Uncharacterized protein n=1 Tax=Trichuris suis TaxID=68888 RepID=A0A085LX70_9BILA|nr:hypothetical protein M513_09591 [Trichuris suis]KFD64217.1 hypothetical protein M514_09591 [Trichuris suis]